MNLHVLIIAVAAASAQPVPEACAVLTPEASRLLGVPAAMLYPAHGTSCAAMNAERNRAVSLSLNAPGTGTPAILATLRGDNSGPEYKDLRDEPSLGDGAYSVRWANGRRLIFRAAKAGDRLATLTIDIGYEPSEDERDAAAEAFARMLK